MKTLDIKGDTDQPRVLFDPLTGFLFMGGSSLPENVIEFFDPVIKWVEEYMRNAPEHTMFEANFEYLNTSSTNVIVRIIDLLSDLKKYGKSISFKWIYCNGDYDMRELGEEIFEETELKYQLLEVDEYIDVDASVSC